MRRINPKSQNTIECNGQEHQPIPDTALHVGFNPKEAHDEDESQPRLIETEPEDWIAVRDQWFSSLSEKYTRVMIKGRHCVGYEGRQGRYKKMEFAEQTQLELKYQNKKIKIGEKEVRGKPVDITRNVITAWAEQPDNNTKDIIFKPNAEEDEEVLNLWRGFSVEPVEADDTAKEGLELIKDHIEKIVCANDPALIKYFYNWNRYTFQYPEMPAGTALVLIGEQGTGKGVIGKFLEWIWGRHGEYISGNRLTKNFNKLLEGVCFVFADEVFCVGDKAAENTLKTYITEEKINIEPKGRDTYVSDNFLKIFMCTNNEKAVPAGKDNRRYCVFNVSNEKRGDTVYFDKLGAAIKCKKVQAAFLYEMLNFDITGFFTGTIPESQGLKEQRYHSMCSVGLWFFDCLSRGSIRTADGNNTSWEQYLTMDLLHKCYINWCNDLDIDRYNRVAAHILGRYLSKLGFDAERKRIGHSREMVRDMKTWDKAVMAFERHEKVTIPRRKTPANENCGQDGQDGQDGLSEEKHEKTL